MTLVDAQGQQFAPFVLVQGPQGWLQAVRLPCHAVDCQRPDEHRHFALLCPMLLQYVN